MGDSYRLILFETMARAIDPVDGLTKTYSGYMAASSWESAEQSAPPYMKIWGKIEGEVIVSEDEVETIKHAHHAHHN